MILTELGRSRQQQTVEKMQQDRSRRAYEVVETYNIRNVALNVYALQSPRGTFATVDANSGWCSCEDFARNGHQVRCKHLEAAGLLALEERVPVCPDCGGEACFCPDPSDEEICGIAARERRIAQAKADRHLWD